MPAPAKSAGKKKTSAAPKRKASKPANGTATERVEHLAEEAGRKLENAGDEIVRQTRAAADGVSAQIASEAAEAVHDLTAARQKRAGDYLTSVSAAISAGQEQLEADGHQATADFAATASERVHAMAEGVDGLDFDTATHKVEDFMRSRPLVSFGAAAILGFAAYKLFKSRESKPARSRS